MRTITSSSMTAFKRCRREYQLAYVLGYKARVEAEPLTIGSAIHSALEVWLKTRSVSGSLAALDGYDLKEQWRAKCRAMIAGYHTRWVDDDVELLAVEKSFKVTRDGYVLQGKIDAVWKDAHGRDYIVDHKTKSGTMEPGGAYWSKLRLDDQITNYFIGARALGYKPVGFLYDVLSKPKIRLKKEETVEEYEERLTEVIAENPDKYYRRGTIVRLKGEVEKQEAANKKTIADMLRVVGSDPEPQTPASCERYGSMCPFFSHCADGADLDQDFLRKKSQHEEL